MLCILCYYCRWSGLNLQTKTTEEGRRAHRPKRCTDNNKDEDNSPINPNNTNYQASSKKFREQKKYVRYNSDSAVEFQRKQENMWGLMK